VYTAPLLGALVQAAHAESTVAPCAQAVRYCPTGQAAVLHGTQAPELRK
jgi:hypothetical protein